MQVPVLAEPQTIDSRLVSWSAAETVLMDYQNTTVINGVYDDLDLYTLISLSVTNFKSQRSWSVYKKRTFNIIKNLSKYFVDPIGFREMQRRTAAVIFGEVPLLYFRRSNVFHGRVDVAIKPIHTKSVVHHLVRTEHFRLWDGAHWTDNTARVEAEVQRFISPISVRTGARSSLRLQQAKSRLERVQYVATKPPSGKQFFFARDAVYGPATQLVLWVAHKGELEVVLESRSSQWDTIAFATVLTWRFTQLPS